jgi:protein TonB
MAVGLLLTASACGSERERDEDRDRDRGRSERSDRDGEEGGSEGGSEGSGNASASAPIPENAMFLVGKWSRRLGCERPVEFLADGVMINHNGERATWSASGSPPTVTLNLPGATVTGSLEQISGGVRIRGAGAGQEMVLFPCTTAAAAQSVNGAGGATGGGDMAAAAPPAIPMPAGGGTPRQIAGSLSDADYPAAAIRAGASGTTRVRLQISAQGRVTGCSVIGSSGNSALDSTTCSHMQRRFRFAPAMRDGRPVESAIEHSMTWRLPGG